MTLLVDTLDEDDGEEAGDNEAGVSPKVNHLLIFSTCLPNHCGALTLRGIKSLRGSLSLRGYPVPDIT